MVVKEEFPVQYDNVQYDLADFLKKHPGGTNYLNGYKSGNITKRMEETNHSKSAKYLLREYMKGGRYEEKMEEQEDLEKLINWNKPLLQQIVSLGHKYNEWVQAPVDRYYRLFENDLLESMTITSWYVIPIVWIPIIMCMLYLGTKAYLNGADLETNQMPYMGLCFFLGLCLWTIGEYCLHRWVFHMVPSGDSSIGILVHFSIHGLHHKIPFDPGRLVFPPVPAAIIAIFFYNVLSIFIPSNIYLLVYSGIVTGYLLYDMIHYYIHYGSPNEGTYLYDLKRYHNKHHFSHSDSGYGVSMIFWDKIFGTTIRMKKLAMAIKW